MSIAFYRGVCVCVTSPHVAATLTFIPQRLNCRRGGDRVTELPTKFRMHIVRRSIFVKISLSRPCPVQMCLVSLSTVWTVYFYYSIIILLMDQSIIITLSFYLCTNLTLGIGKVLLYPLLDSFLHRIVQFCTISGKTCSFFVKFISFHVSRTRL